MFHKQTREFPSRIDPNDGFRQRRRRHRRRVQQRRIGAIVIVVGLVVALAFGFRAVTEGDPPTIEAETVSPPTTPLPPSLPPGPSEIVLPNPMKGVHVTMPLVEFENKFEEFLSLKREGLNTLQVDVKDEKGLVAFAPATPLAQRIGAVGNFYNATELADRVHDAGLFLVGRIVVFQDPVLAEARKKLSIKNKGGGNWKTHQGLGWTNPYKEAVWQYNVDIAEAAARAGFDEIMFDYIRFPTDGDEAALSYPNQRPEAKAETIARFLSYAKRRLDPLGVKVGAAVFGLAATRNIGIGQAPRKMANHLDIVHPMVYPQAYGPGECNISNPVGSPGRVVSCSLQDFKQALAGRDVEIIPWLQDYGGYDIDDIRAQVAAAERWQTGGYLLWNGASVYTPGTLNIR